MRRFQGWALSLVIWMYLLGTSLSAAHIHHHPDTPDHDCKVCLVVKNIHASDAPSQLQFDISLDAYRIEGITSHTFLLSTRHKGFNAQAPPLS